MMEPYFSRDGIEIYHGDCRDVLPQLSGIDCYVTSPPFNQIGNMPDKPSGMHAETNWVDNTRSVTYADDMPEDEYQEFIKTVLDACGSAASERSSMFFNHKCRWRDKRLIHPIDIVRLSGCWSLRQEIIWSRAGSTTLNAKLFGPSEERIFWLTRSPDEWVWNQQAASYLSVWHIAQDRVANGHPCPFPAEIPKRCIIACSAPNGVVCDPFMGSGTTLEAALLLQNQAVGIEREERFCELAAKRFDQAVFRFAG